LLHPEEFGVKFFKVKFNDGKLK